MILGFWIPGYVVYTVAWGTFAILLGFIVGLKTHECKEKYLKPPDPEIIQKIKKVLDCLESSDETMTNCISTLRNLIEENKK